MASTFYCTCGHCFHARDVSEAIETLVLTCQRLVDILEASTNAHSAFNDRTSESFRGFVTSVLHGLGKAAGFVIGKLLGKLV